jgi:hypothetical protein
MMVANMLTTIQKDEKWSLHPVDFQAASLMLHDLVAEEERTLLRKRFDTLNKEEHFQLWITGSVLGKMLARKLRATTPAK